MQSIRLPIGKPFASCVSSRYFAQSVTTRRFFIGGTSRRSATKKESVSDSTMPDPVVQKEQLALPETAHNPTTQLDVSNGGTTVKLDHLGPMVVSEDGTLSRISNWEGMTEMEKKNTIRIIGKRNQARLAALRAKEGEA